MSEVGKVGFKVQGFSSWSKGLLRLGQVAAVVVASLFTAAAATESGKPESAGDHFAPGVQNSFSPRLLRATPRQPFLVSSSYTPLEVAKYYNFPRGTDGQGQTIGIIELGGGYNNDDLKAYFKKLGVPMPNVTWVSVDGAQNNPSLFTSNEDIEVALDIEIAGAVAPKANIVVYFAPNTDDGFTDAVRAATWDREHHPSIVSISWGLSEADSNPAGLRKTNQAFREAALRGITIFVSSGDNGSPDASRDGKDHVDFPAASPWVVACGGTSLIRDDQGAMREVTWNNNEGLLGILGGGGATGGGVSQVFAMPSWQQNAGVPNPEGEWWRGRGVPDVSANADPYTGYSVLVNGSEIVVGGTSAVSPLWAGLTARLNQGLGGYSIGYINPAIYTSQFSDSFNDIVSGNNGTYTAIAGWDATTGIGSPNGENLLGAFRAKYAWWGSDRQAMSAQTGPQSLLFSFSTGSPWERIWLERAFPGTAGDILPLRKSG